jgi:hypothetical protein
VGVLLTEIEWPVEGERYTEPSCSRRENAVGLGGVLAAACGVGASGGTDSTYHIDPQRDAHEQIWGTLNNWAGPTFQQWFLLLTFGETYSHGIPGLYSVSVVCR